MAPPAAALGSLGLVAASGALWAIEVLAWRKAAALGMGMFAMTAWSAAAMGACGVGMLASTQLQAPAPVGTVQRSDKSANDAEAVWCCVAAGVSWIVACFCFNAGMTGMPSAGIANGVSVVTQTCLILAASWVAFGERVTDPKQVAGIALMMVGMVLVNLK